MDKEPELGAADLSFPEVTPPLCPPTLSHLQRGQSLARGGGCSQQTSERAGAGDCAQATHLRDDERRPHACARSGSGGPPLSTALLSTVQATGSLRAAPKQTLLPACYRQVSGNLGLQHAMPTSPTSLPRISQAFHHPASAQGEVISCPEREERPHP